MVKTVTGTFLSNGSRSFQATEIAFHARLQLLWPAVGLSPCGGPPALTFR